MGCETIRTDRIIVFDTQTPAFVKNKVFDPVHASYFPEANAITCLHTMAAKKGWGMMTGDVFLESRPSFGRAVCLSQEVSRQTGKILAMGVEPKLLFSGESPNVSWKFYRNLRTLSKDYVHAFLFKGFADRVDGSVKFHDYRWPIPDPIPLEEIEFQDRKLLAMPSSFKERFGLNRANVLSWLYFPIRSSRILYYQATDPLARFPDLYRTRIDAVQAFAHKDQFYLMGRNWDVACTYVNNIRKLDFANPPGEFDDKSKILSSFRFTLVIENCIFPGYVTEKIFDAMLAGTVPIYIGAPDIEDFVPSDCFLDFRKYGSFDELWTDIASWTETRWTLTRRDIECFISSSQFEPFRRENVAEKFFNWLTEST